MLPKPTFIYSTRIRQISTEYILNSYHPLIFSSRIETVYAKVGFGTDAHTLTALRLRILAAYLLFCIGSVFRFTLYVAHITLAWLPHNGWYSNFPGVTPYLQRKIFTSGGHRFLLNNVILWKYLICSFSPTPYTNSYFLYYNILTICTIIICNNYHYSLV